MQWAKRYERFLPCLLAAALPALLANAQNSQGADMGKYLTPENTIADMLAHPALADFASHMLPRPEDAGARLKFTEIGRLMPWHSHIDPQVVTAGVNRLIADSDRGEQFFYSFYPDKYRGETGLFFFRGKPGQTFAIICLGGGFRYVGKQTWLITGCPSDCCRDHWQ